MKKVSLVIYLIISIAIAMTLLTSCKSNDSITFIIPEEAAIRTNRIKLDKSESYNTYFDYISKYLKPNYVIENLFLDKSNKKKVETDTDLKENSVIYVKTVQVEGLEGDLVIAMSKAMYNLKNHELIGNTGYISTFIISFVNGKTKEYTCNINNEQSWSDHENRITYFFKNGIKTKLKTGSSTQFSLDLLATEINLIVKSTNDSVRMDNGFYTIHEYMDRYAIKFENGRITEFIIYPGYYVPGQYVVNYGDSQIPDRPEGLYHEMLSVEYYPMGGSSWLTFDTTAIIDYEELLIHSFNVLGAHYLDYFTKEDLYYDEQKKHKVVFDENGKHILLGSFAVGQDLNIYIDFKRAYKGDEDTTKNLEDALLASQAKLNVGYTTVEETDIGTLYWQYDGHGNCIRGYKKVSAIFEVWYSYENGEWFTYKKISDSLTRVKGIEHEEKNNDYFKYVQYSMNDIGFIQISDNEYLGFGYYYGKVYVVLKDGLIKHISKRNFSMDIFYGKEASLIPQLPDFE